MQIRTPVISSFNRAVKTALQVIIDFAIIIFAFSFAFLWETEGFSHLWQTRLLAAITATAIITISSLHILGLYKVLIRFLTGKILITVAKGSFIAIFVLYVSVNLLNLKLPISIYPFFGTLVFIQVGGIRFLARGLLRSPVQGLKRPVLIYGAGDSGLQLLNSLFHGREYAPVAFVDDNPDLHGLSIGGLVVYSPDEIPTLMQVTGAQIVMLAIPSVGRARRRDIVQALENFRIEIKTIPSFTEIISGRAKLSELRAVSTEDLLGRDPISPDPKLMKMNIVERVVMVTGAGGSIGSELCRQILTLNPKALVLFEMSEFALYQIEKELSSMMRNKKVETNIIPILGSVRDIKRVEYALSEFKVETLFHAAAYKHVPLLEDNVIEAVLNNVFGTFTLSKAAKMLGVKNFILISTDKAVRPTNVMGASKRIAELICQAYAQDGSETTFSMVRFGNVLGSSGSVIPLFQAQIESGGPVTVTHKDVTRYFMTIPEASQLVIQAGAMGKGGDVFVLDMGDPVKIIDVAVSMVKLHGLTPYIVDQRFEKGSTMGDIPICFTGLRKGEKLFEELLIGNNPLPTQHPRIMTASEVSLPMHELMHALARLRVACDNVDLPSVIQIMHELPIGYRSPDYNLDLDN